VKDAIRPLSSQSRSVMYLDKHETEGDFNCKSRAPFARLLDFHVALQINIPQRVSRAIAFRVKIRFDYYVG
jgi:hypothetical protein